MSSHPISFELIQPALRLRTKLRRPDTLPKETGLPCHGSCYVTLQPSKERAIVTDARYSCTLSEQPSMRMNRNSGLRTPSPDSQSTTPLTLAERKAKACHAEARAPPSAARKSTNSQRKTRECPKPGETSMELRQLTGDNERRIFAKCLADARAMRGLRFRETCAY